MQYYSTMWFFMCAVCVYIWGSTHMYIHTYMNTTSWSLLKDAVSITIVRSTSKFFWPMYRWKPSVEVKVWSLWTLLSPSVQCDGTVKSSRKQVLKSCTTPLLTNHCCSTCSKVAQKTSPWFKIISGERKHVYVGVSVSQ